MGIGEAKHRAELQCKVLTADGGGGFVESWEAYASVWAALEALEGDSEIEAGRGESRVRCRITIRRRTDVVINHRVKLGARRLAIRAVIDEGAPSLWMTLLCEEGAPS